MANPNNPTGTYIYKKDLILLRKKLRKNILLVIDDAYDEYMLDKNYSSGLDIFKNKKNVFILRTFSKIYGLASLRIGWGYGDKKIINALNIIKPPFNVNKFAQLCAMEALSDSKFISKSVKHNYFWAKKIKKEVERFNINTNSVSANFLLLNFNKCKLTAAEVNRKLQKNGLILRETKIYGIKNSLRITIGNSKENKKGIQLCNAQYLSEMRLWCSEYTKNITSKINNEKVQNSKKKSFWALKLLKADKQKRPLKGSGQIWVVPSS